ncbi:MAG: SAM-dependent methyltransferase [Actinobacteria bacterium]|nr:SAM-dependent methyltransferase [Actinomycetota bacterium]
MNIELEPALDEAEGLIRGVDKLVRVVLSGKRRDMSPLSMRVDIRPISLKGKILLQVVENDGRQATTKNHLPDILDVRTILNSGFSNIHIDHVEGSFSIRITKKEAVLVNRNKERLDQHLEHDHQKVRFLDPSDAYLREVGISDVDGRIKPSRQDKYRQVEEFLRLLVPSLNSAIAAGHIAEPTVDRPLQLVDLGCGSAYLTFAVHQYLQSHSIPIHVTGIDVRVDSRDKNTEVAGKLAIADSIEFIAQVISSADLAHVDVVMALHACDTATDDAISWAVNHDAKLVLVAPCCHHDLQSQITDPPEPWKLVTKNGLLKERFADLLTDALRAQILKLVGYRSEVIEFVGDAHTPRNLMIRALRTNAAPSKKDLDEYKNMISLWNVQPALADRLSSRMMVVLNDL